MMVEEKMSRAIVRVRYEKPGYPEGIAIRLTRSYTRQADRLLADVVFAVERLGPYGLWLKSVRDS